MIQKQESKVEKTPDSVSSRLSMAKLIPLKHLDQIAAATPEAEPPLEELTRALKSGHQPYPVITADSCVLFGLGLLTAASEVGVSTVEVSACPGCDGFHDADLLLRAAGLHLRAARDRLPSTLPSVLTAAEIYQVWVRHRRARSPRTYQPAKRRAWKELRERLIREEFGYAQRTLVRYSRLLTLRSGLREAVDRGQLPRGEIERASALSSLAQDRLAAELGDGAPFADLREKYFGRVNDRRKSPIAVARAVRAAVRLIVTEARGREDTIGLRPEDHPIAREAAEYISRWLAAPLPAQTLEEAVRGLGEEFQRDASRPASRGGRGARGIRA